MNRDFLLQKIFDNFVQMRQWIFVPNNYNKYYDKSLTLVELIEVEDCGSVGGFDKNNPHKIVTGLPVYDRFLTLVRKNKTKISKDSNISIKDMTKYFNTIRLLK